MNIALTGTSGLVGSALLSLLKEQGHAICKLVRFPVNTTGSAYWNPASREIDSGKLEGMDGVIHLAGENIANRRWTPAQKERIRHSRVDSTRFLVQALCRCKQPPKTLLVASAIGFYGDRGDTLLTEADPPGTGFLPDVCRDWEDAAQEARQAGIRVVHVRIGIVLSRQGGALHRMLPIFQLGGGGPVGSGKQFMSWITRSDLARVFLFLLEHPEISGPVNAVAPHPVTNRQWTQVLGKALKRPAWMPVPAFGLRLLMGEMADALLLASTRVEPTVLIRHGFSFQAPDLEAGLAIALADRP